MSRDASNSWGSDDDDEFFDALESFESSDSDESPCADSAPNKDALATLMRMVAARDAALKQTSEAYRASAGQAEHFTLPAIASFPTSTHPELPLHWAVFYNRRQQVQQLLATLSLEKIHALDSHGNNALHIAAFQEHEDIVEMLLANGFSALSKSGRGWTALDEAVSVKNQNLAILLAKQELKEIKDKIKGQQKLLLQTLLELPDYSLQLKWELASSVPGLSMLIRKYLPHDTYSIWKMGQLLRVDGTLMGVDSKSGGIIPDWKRGHFSILFDGSGAKSTLYFVNRKKNTYVDVQAEKRKNKECDSKEDSDEALAEERVKQMLMQTQVERPKLQAADVKFKPARGWFGGEMTEKIEGWNTKVYDATAKIRRLSRGKTCFRLPPSATFEDYLNHNYEEDPMEAVNPWAGIMDESQTGPPSESPAEHHNGEKEKGSKAPKRLKISGRCWMAEDFPMSLRQLLPLLDVVGTANKHISKVAKFMNKYGNLNMFPVKAQVSIWLSVYALISFRQFRPLTSKDAVTEEFFRLPKGAKLVSLQEILERQTAKMNALQEEQDRLEAEGIDFDDSDFDLIGMEGSYRDSGN